MTTAPAPGFAAPDPVVEMVAISVSYQGPGSQERLRVLDRVSLAARPGEFVVVAGRSGSGKTTLLHAAAGLLRVADGEVRWQGTPLDDLTSDEVATRRRSLIGIVLQSGGLLDQLTAAENVALPRVPDGVRTDARRRALDLLALVGLAGRARHYPAQLSGGERQRVALARALFADPEILIADEPTANLDRATADRLIDLMAELNADGRTMLVASHDPNLIARADHLIELR